MRNPLRKRIPRQFVGDMGKNLAIFVFMMLTIGMCSGFFAGGDNLSDTYDATFERYNMEDGHFILNKKPSDGMIKHVAKDSDIYEDFYVEIPCDMKNDGKYEGTVRLFGPRVEVNKVCLMEGEMPRSKNEVALDRLYLKNNDVSVGDTVTIDGKKMKVSGIVALSDYSTLFQKNTDLMFDSVLFGVGVLTEDGFKSFGKGNLHYNYAWKYHEAPVDDEEKKEKSDDLSKLLFKHAEIDDVEIDDFVPAFLNQSIIFAGDDIGGDAGMMRVLLYVLLVILAFIFAITVSREIESESTVIGTLRASGYTRGEIFRHYITMPVIITILSAIVGNLVGYKFFEKACADIYMNSYSLTTYESIFRPSVVIETTIVPTVIMICVIFITLARKLDFTPLQFLRRDIVRRKREKAVKLPHFRFMTRFKLRVLIQNASGYFVLTLGILFAGLLLFFGLAAGPMIDDYNGDAIKNMHSKYQYYLNEPYGLPADKAEKFASISLKIVTKGAKKQEVISVYGLKENSKFFSDMKMPKAGEGEGVVITSDYAEKYGVEKGDIINLKDRYSNKVYAFKVYSIYDYKTNIAVYMPMEDFADAFGFYKGYFTGYFSDVKFSDDDLPEEKVASVISVTELTKVTRQLTVSMGSVFGMIKYVALVIFALILYLLVKVILERNALSISITKILGYNTLEITGLYILATVWVVIIATVISLVANTALFNILLKVMMKDYPGWFSVQPTMELYLQMMGMILGTFFVIAFFLMLKIKKIPMTDALKNVE